MTIVARDQIIIVHGLGVFLRRRQPPATTSPLPRPSCSTRPMQQVIRHEGYRRHLITLVEERSGTPGAAGSPDTWSLHSRDQSAARKPSGKEQSLQSLGRTKPSKTNSDPARRWGSRDQIVEVMLCIAGHLVPHLVSLWRNG